MEIICKSVQGPYGYYFNFWSFAIGFLKEYIDASIILAVILMNALIGLFQEYKAEKQSML